MKLMIRLLTLGSLCGAYGYAERQAMITHPGPTPMCITVFKGGSYCCGTTCGATSCSGICSGS